MQPFKLKSFSDIFLFLAMEIILQKKLHKKNTRKSNSQKVFVFEKIDFE